MIEDYGKYQFSYYERVKIFILGYGAIFLVTMLFYKNTVVAIISGFACLLLYKPISNNKAKKRKDLLLIQFKDMLYSLAGSIGAGGQMTKALFEAKENIGLIYDADTPMIKELEYITKSITENRESEEVLLLDLARRSSQEDIKNFVDVYRACRISGGDMERVISNAVEILIEKIEIEKEIEALTGQKKFEGKVVMGMPFLVIIFLNIFSPEYVDILYTSMAGRIVMSIAILGIIAAYIITGKILDIKV